MAIQPASQQQNIKTKVRNYRTEASSSSSVSTAKYINSSNSSSSSTSKSSNVDLNRYHQHYHNYHRHHQQKDQQKQDKQQQHHNLERIHDYHDYHNVKQKESQSTIKPRYTSSSGYERTRTSITNDITTKSTSIEINLTTATTATTCTILNNEQQKTERQQQREQQGNSQNDSSGSRSSSSSSNSIGNNGISASTRCATNTQNYQHNQHYCSEAILSSKQYTNMKYNSTPPILSLSSVNSSIMDDLIFNSTIATTTTAFAAITISSSFTSSIAITATDPAALSTKTTKSPRTGTTTTPQEIIHLHHNEPIHSFYTKQHIKQQTSLPSSSLSFLYKSPSLHKSSSHILNGSSSGSSNGSSIKNRKPKSKDLHAIDDYNRSDYATSSFTNNVDANAIRNKVIMEEDEEDILSSESASVTATTTYPSC